MCVWGKSWQGIRGTEIELWSVYRFKKIIKVLVNFESPHLQKEVGTFFYIARRENFEAKYIRTVYSNQNRFDQSVWSAVLPPVQISF